jgi:LysM repeat protein
MKNATSAAASAASLLTALILSSCGNFSTTGQTAGTGPFDSRGNYIEEWAVNPSKWRQGSSPRPTRTTPPPVVTPDIPAIAKNEQPPSRSIPLDTSRPAPTRPAPPQVVSKPKPKPAPAKPKPKPSTTVRHTVRKGDTLYGLALKYKSSVAAIQSANGIKGTIIQPGKVLTIPRR